jgi:hypothetical protein
MTLVSLSRSTIPLPSIFALALHASNLETIFVLFLQSASTTGPGFYKRQDSVSMYYFSWRTISITT